MVVGAAIAASGTVRVTHPAPATLPTNFSYTLSPTVTSTTHTTASSSPASRAVPSKTPEQLALLTNADWKKMLTAAQYAVLRESGTEIPFTSPLLHETRTGTFVTADCGEPVFRSEKKFYSGTGWPSFYAPISSSSVVIKTDTTLGMTREEVETPICHSHLGHLFHDAPQTPTGDRYCINGVALKFIPDAGQ